jgi:hypothetical protein
VAINDNIGDIISCDESLFSLWDVNGEIILSQKLSPLDQYDPISTCLPFEGKPALVYDSDLFFTGHSSGSIRIWKKNYNVDHEKWELSMQRKLDSGMSAAITYFYVGKDQRFLVSSDSIGRSVIWILPDGSGTEAHYTNSEQCIKCSQKTPVLARRLNCRTCGGSYCGQCLQFVPEKNIKLCSSCYIVYSSNQIE